jgi:hypothetical protein
MRMRGLKLVEIIKVIYLSVFILVFTSTYCHADLSTQASETSSASKLLEYINPLDIWKISPGVGFRAITLRVNRKSDGYTGVLTNDDNARDGNMSDLLYFTLDVESPAWMFSDYYGVSMRSSTQAFKVFRQELPPTPPDTYNQAVDLGTSIDGFFSYIGPTLFTVLDFDKSFKGHDRAGVGLVYWDARFSGDIILAENNNVSDEMARTDIGGSIKNGLGSILYYQRLGEGWLIEMSLAKMESSSSEYNVELEEFNFVFGMMF